ncbi:MAG TPA: NAD(P)-binding domain-containing protein, partial [Nitrososphaera sp.]|nr:NAD(P)-binding domain-containing protein [Nitrososphaera sp.]
MKIGIIGSGEVGQRLGDGFIELGHTVKIGTRDPQKVAAWVEKHGDKASAGSFSEAAEFGEDMVAIATLWTGTQSAIEMA